MRQIKVTAITCGSFPNIKPMMIRPNKKFRFTLAAPLERSTLRSRRAIVPRLRDEGGFTLVELLIAAAITVVIVVMLGLMLGSLMSSASHASQRIDAFRDARAALQMMERDLSNLVRTHWNIKTSPVPTPTPSPITGPAAYFVLSNIYTDPAAGNQQVFALVAAKNKALGVTSEPAGDLCAVGYYARWEGNRYTLRRYFRDSYELMAGDSYFSSQSPSRPTPPWNIRANGLGNYMSGDKLFQPADVTDLKANPPTIKDDALAQYVWNLKVTAYDSGGNPLPYPFVCDGSATDPTSPTGQATPAAVEISFNAMSPQAARTVMSVSSAPTDWMDTTTQNYQRLVKPHAYEFRTRINLQ
jgi:type II secretory pathway pseudopilin PulG